LSHNRPLVAYAVRVAEFVKIQFALEADADGWPPVESEGLWAIALGDNSFRVDNTPWFVCGIAAGDVVRAEPRDGQWWFAERLAPSGNSAIRVIPFRHGALQGDRRTVLDMFERYGATGEVIEHYGIVALDIPPQADLAGVQALLREGFDEGWWDIDEGCVGETWHASARL
jgi:hypothetical protein